MKEAKQQELRWHLAVIVPRLLLSLKEIQLAKDLLCSFLEDRSSIVKTCTFQGLADLTMKEPSLRPTVVDILRGAARSGTSAMRARSRKLLSALECD